MEGNFFAYLQLLELVTFFSGYPVLYSVILFIAGNNLNNQITSRIVSLLPFSYALTGTLYLALQIKNLYPDYSPENINKWVQHPLLISWAFLSVLFWIPALAKRKTLSLIHSLVFFLLMVKDLFVQFTTSNADRHILKNDMNMFSYSLLINLAAISIVVILSFIIIPPKKDKLPGHQ